MLGKKFSALEKSCEMVSFFVHRFDFVNDKQLLSIGGGGLSYSVEVDVTE